MGELRFAFANKERMQNVGKRKGRKGVVSCSLLVVSAVRRGRELHRAPYVQSLPAGIRESSVVQNRKRRNGIERLRNLVLLLLLYCSVLPCWDPAHTAGAAAGGARQPPDTIGVALPLQGS